MIEAFESVGQLWHYGEKNDQIRAKLSACYVSNRNKTAQVGSINSLKFTELPMSNK